MQDQTQETLLEMDDLDSLTLDDVEEAPEFMTPPSGRYNLGISKADIFKRESEDGETQAIRVIYFTRETIELNSAEEDRVPDGSLFSETFGIPDGLKYFKTRMKQVLGGNVDGITIKDMLEALPTVFGEDGDKQISATLKKTVTKKDGNEYENVRFQKCSVIDRG